MGIHFGFRMYAQHRNYIYGKIIQGAQCMLSDK